MPHKYQSSTTDQHRGTRRACQPSASAPDRTSPPNLTPAQRDQAFGDEGAIESLQRHDVGNGAERDQIEPRQQIGLRTLSGPVSTLTQFAIDRDDGDEDQPNRGEVAET